MMRAPGLIERGAGWLRKHAEADRNSLVLTITSAKAERPFQIELPSWSLRLLATILLAGFMLVVAGGVLYGRLIRDTLVLREVRKENLTLRAQMDRLAAIEDEVAKIDRLRRQLLELTDSQEETPVGLDGQDVRAEAIAAAADVSSGDLTPGAAGTPFRCIPFAGRVSRGFRPGADASSHLGVDVAGAPGSEVRAAADGIVEFASWDAVFGNLVILRHDDGWVSRYGHNEQLLVAESDSVRAGQAIARLGSTGQSSAPHLHFEIAKEGRPFGPGRFFRGYAPEEERH
ncbi:MAG: peptidoglycan DD-metalloendopeptidase family protein [Candidatus Eisenbacteria bacterium]